MAALRLSIFFTFVLMILSANGSQKENYSELLKNSYEKGEKKEGEVVPPNLENLDLTIPKEMKKSSRLLKRKSFFYSFREAMAPHIGFSSGKFGGSSQTSTFHVGVHYSQNPTKSFPFEVSAQILGAGGGVFQYNRRWIYSSSTRYRPFWKAGGGLKTVAKEGLANFINYRNFVAIGGGGLEYTLFGPISLRGDIEVLVGIQNTFINLSMGYSWAW